MAHLTAKLVLEMVAERAHGLGTRSHALSEHFEGRMPEAPKSIPRFKSGVTTLCEKKSSNTYLVLW
jgi:hypothetical protein